MGTHPKITTASNIKNIKRQINEIAAIYDWDMEVNTTDPNFYKWTQWIFVKMFKAGLAYEKEMPINWCPSCKTGLANEEVVDGCCERCGSPVTKKNLKQWMLRITKYADRLLNDLDKLDWLCTGRAPVDRHFFFVSKTCFKHFYENPLCPLIEVWICCIYFHIPVIDSCDLGWDAFGLPAENYAIKMGTHPKITTASNIKNIKRHGSIHH